MVRRPEPVASTSSSPGMVTLTKLVAVAFAAVGVLLALSWDGAVLAPLRSLLAQAAHGASEPPAEIRPFVGASLGILGGTIFGKWVAAAMLVAGPVAAGERWAWRAGAAGLVTWFVLEAAAMLARGHVALVLAVGVPTLVAFGVPLLAVRRHATTDTPPPELTRAERVLAIVCLGFGAFGVVLAAAATTPLFFVYAQGIAHTWFEGQAPAAVEAWQGVVYPAIGATFAGHFVMLALAVRNAPDRAFARRLVAVSMLAWFLLDSSTGVAHGAWFNVLGVNLLSLVAVAVPWWLSRPRG